MIWIWISLFGYFPGQFSRNLALMFFQGRCLYFIPRQTFVHSTQLLMCLLLELLQRMTRNFVAISVERKHILWTWAKMAFSIEENKEFTHGHRSGHDSLISSGSSILEETNLSHIMRFVIVSASAKSGLWEKRRARIKSGNEEYYQRIMRPRTQLWW